MRKKQPIVWLLLCCFCKSANKPCPHRAGGNPLLQHTHTTHNYALAAGTGVGIPWGDNSTVGEVRSPSGIFKVLVLHTQSSERVCQLQDEEDTSYGDRLEMLLDGERLQIELEYAAKGVDSTACLCWVHTCMLTQTHPLSSKWGGRGRRSQRMFYLPCTTHCGKYTHIHTHMNWLAHLHCLRWLDGITDSMDMSLGKHWSGLPFPSPMHESGKWNGHEFG